MQNALDHSLDPISGIKEMLKILKTNRKIFLTHIQNEAESECYAGFHQWNFSEDSEKFLIWNKDERIIVDDVFKKMKFSTIHRDNLIETTIQKI